MYAGSLDAKRTAGEPVPLSTAADPQRRSFLAHRRHPATCRLSARSNSVLGQPQPQTPHHKTLHLDLSCRLLLTLHYLYDERP